MKKVFSAKELLIIKIIGRKKIKLTDIKKEIYGKSNPMHCSIIIANAVRSIEKKCRVHKLNWTLASEGLGRAGKTVWKTMKRGS